MSARSGLRCRHAFEAATIHANGEVVCSIIDGRGDFVLGNVHEQSLPEILSGPRTQELRRLVLSTRDNYCLAIGKRCPLKSITGTRDQNIGTELRFLAIEPTTACDLRCLCCPVRDFSRRITWRDAYRDGGLRFLLWDGLRRSKQHAADALRLAIPALRGVTPAQLGRAAGLLRGRVPRTRTGTLPLDLMKRVITDAGPQLERIDLFNYGEPFLYRHLLDTLRHIRIVSPKTTIAISTDGMQIRPDVEQAIVEERLLDWLIVSIDGADGASYRRYRIGGDFDVAFSHLTQFHQRAAGTSIRVVWQYVVFSWNDRDHQFKRAIAMADAHGIPLWFDFAHTWGRSRRKAEEMRYLTPYLKPFTALPSEPRREGW